MHSMATATATPPPFVAWPSYTYQHAYSSNSSGTCDMGPIHGNSSAAGIATCAGRTGPGNADGKRSCAQPKAQRRGYGCSSSWQQQAAAQQQAGHLQHSTCQRPPGTQLQTSAAPGAHKLPAQPAAACQQQHGSSMELKSQLHTQLHTESHMWAPRGATMLKRMVAKMRKGIMGKMSSNSKSSCLAGDASGPLAPSSAGSAWSPGAHAHAAGAHAGAAMSDEVTASNPMVAATVTSGTTLTTAFAHSDYASADGFSSAFNGAPSTIPRSNHKDGSIPATSTSTSSAYPFASRIQEAYELCDVINEDQNQPVHPLSAWMPASSPEVSVVPRDGESALMHN